MSWKFGHLADQDTTVETKQFRNVPAGYGTAEVLSFSEQADKPGNFKLEINNIDIPHPLNPDEEPGTGSPNYKTTHFASANGGAGKYFKRLLLALGFSEDEIRDCEFDEDTFVGRTIHMFFKPGDRDAGVYPSVFPIPVDEWEKLKDTHQLPPGFYEKKPAPANNNRVASPPPRSGNNVRVPGNGKPENNNKPVPARAAAKPAGNFNANALLDELE